MKLKFLIVGLLLMFAFAACSSSEEADDPGYTAGEDAGYVEDGGEDAVAGETATGEPIRIGIIAPLTGGAALFGQAASDGSILAFEQANAAGGILGGRPIEFIRLDDEGAIPVSIAAYERLVYSDEVVAIVGPVTSGPSNAVAGIAEGHRTPMISPTATAADVTLGRDFMFRACFLDATQAQAVAYFARNNYGAQTAAILFNNSMDYSRGLAENFEIFFERMGGTITNSLAYATGDTDFRAQLTTIAAGNPDILFLPEYFTNVSLKSRQAREAGITATLFGADGWEGVLELLGEDASIMDGSFFSAHFATDDPNPIVQNFVSTYTERFDISPSSFAALGFDAARIIINAIEQAGSTDNDAIINAMQNITYDGVTGSITFDSNGNPIKPIVMISIDNASASLYHRFDVGYFD